MKSYKQNIQAYMCLLRGGNVLEARKDDKYRTWKPEQASEWASLKGINEADIHARMLKAAYNIAPTQTALSTQGIE